MLGTIVGNIVGSRFEFRNHKSKEFDFLVSNCFPTDDSIMSLAIASAILMCDANYKDLGSNATKCMQTFGRKYSYSGYGKSFSEWIFSDNPQPYNSWGNGAAMRISPVGFVAKDIDEVKRLSKAVTEVKHNHAEGLKGAEATAVAIFLARKGWDKNKIKKYITDNYYNIDFTLDSIREDYKFHVSCQKSIPQALEAFFESTSFEDAIRNAISIGGDSDTIAAITGGVAEAYYGIPDDIQKKTKGYLDNHLLEILNLFEKIQKER